MTVYCLFYTTTQPMDTMFSKLFWKMPTPDDIQDQFNGDLSPQQVTTLLEGNDLEMDGIVHWIEPFSQPS